MIVRQSSCDRVQRERRDLSPIDMKSMAKELCQPGANSRVWIEILPTIARGFAFVLALSTAWSSLAQVPLLKWKASVYGANGSSTILGGGAPPFAKKSIALDAAGNVFVTGAGIVADGNRDYLTVKYSSQGEMLWRAVSNNGVDSDNSPHGIVVDTDGNVVVTGNSTKNGNFDILTIKYDSSGLEVWRAIYAVNANSHDVAHAVSLDPAGNVYVLGISTGKSGNALIKYDKSGNELWRTQIENGPSGPTGRALLAVDAFGNAYATRDSGAFCSGQSPVLCTAFRITKYSPDGTIQWANGIFDTNGSDYFMQSFAADAVGNTIVSGIASRLGCTEFFAAKYSPTGTQLWLNFDFTNSCNSNAPADMVVDSTGNVFATGLGDDRQRKDAMTIGYNSAGQQLWQSNLNGVANADDNSFAIVLDAAENPYIVGSSNNGVNFDLLVARLSRAGVEQWRATYNGTGNANDQGRAVAVDSAGNVFVAGMSVESGAPSAIFIAKYAQVPFEFLSAASVKTHGNSGNFELPIADLQTVNDPITVESRMGGTGHKIIFHFNYSIASLVSVQASIGYANATKVGSDVIVDLSDVPDNCRATISLSGVNNLLDVSATIGFLVGDVNNSRSVNSSDISAFKARTATLVSSTNFVFDVNGDGVVDGADLAAVKARSGLAIY